MKRPFFGYFFVAFIIFFPVLFPRNGQMLMAFDVTHFYFFMRAFFVTSLRHGFFPWWNPYTFSGMPFAESPQIVTVLYPPNWIFLVLPINVAFSWYFFIHIVVAMCGMYVFLRSIRDEISVPRLAAWFGGLAFGLSGFFLARTYVGHLDMVAAASLMPWVFAAFWQLFKKQQLRWIFLAAGLLVLQLFAGYPTVALFTVEAAGIAGVVQSLFARSWRPMVLLLFAGIVAFGLGAVQLIPNEQFLWESTRHLPAHYGWAASYTAPLSTVFSEMLSPPSNLNAVKPEYDYHERAAFIGVTAFILALFGLGTAVVVRRRGVLLAALFCIGLFGLWAGLAKYAGLNLFAVLWVLIPLYRQLRIPPRHFLLMVFALSALSGLGMAYIIKNGFFRKIYLPVILALILFLELYSYARGYIAMGAVPSAGYDKALVSMLTENPQYRFLPYYHISRQPSFFYMNSPVSTGVFSVTGTESSIVTRYYRFMGAVNGVNLTELDSYYDQQVPYRNIESPYVDFLNVKYLVVPEWDNPVSATSTRYHPVYTNAAEGFLVYENTQVMPRYTFMTDVKKVSDTDAALTLVRAGSVDPHKAVIITGENAPNSACAGKSGRITKYSETANMVTVSVFAGCPGYVVGSEVMYPGWTATVDGKSVPVYEANAAFRAVFVPEGEHTVILSYDPYAAYAGLAITIFTIVICLWYSRRHA